MKGFIIYPTYRIINNKPCVLLFGKLENSQAFLTINPFQPYFFIKTKDLSKAKNLLKQYSTKKTNLKNFKNGQVTKVTVDVPSTVPKLRRGLEEKNITCYEADIKFFQRFLMDNNIKGSLNIEGDYETSDLIDRIYKEPTITPIKFIPKLKTFSIDIETSSDLKKLYSIAIYSENFQKTLIISKEKIPMVLTFKDEESLLEEFKEIILEQDPDIITGWNVVDFDLNYLKDKFQYYKIPFTLGRSDEKCKLKIQKDFFRDSKADFPGRMILDGISLLKSSLVKITDYKLSTAAAIFLSDKKLLGEENRPAEIEKLFKQNPKKLAEYNLKDAELAYNIIKKLKLIDLTITRSLITGIQLDRVSGSIASLDSLYLRDLRKRNYVAPSSTFSQKTTPAKGGYVMESIPGIYDNIIVLDFKSLYPSIMKTFNIDPLSYLGKTKEKEFIEAPNGARFSRRQGILPSIIQSIWEERDKVKKQKNEIASFALKTIMASFIGVMGNPSYRFFNSDIINAITHFGQFIIKLTAKEIEKLDYKVIYSDTDSVFIQSKTQDSKKAEKIGKEIEKKINTFFENYVKKNYNVKNFLELEFEKNYLRFLMPKIRGGTAGAKKRYAGLRLINKKEKIDFVGIETARSDWTNLAKKFQLELLNRIFHKKEVTEFIKQFVTDTKKGKYDKLLIYRKQLRKGLEGYAVKTPHLKAARKLKEFKGGLVEYYITTDGPEPIQNQKHKIDYEHYIKKQIKPIADSVLIFFNTTFEDLLEGSKQTKLF